MPEAIKHITEGSFSSVSYQYVFSVNVQVALVGCLKVV